MRVTPIAFVALATSAPSFCDVLDVDATAGPYFEIRDAVAAAANGDIVRVHAGAYGYFGVFGKGLTVLAAEFGVEVQGGIRVQSTSADQLVHLVGLDVRPPIEEALIVASTEGAVRVEDCRLIGVIDADPTSSFKISYRGARIQNATDVAFVACTFAGSTGAQVEDSTVAFHGCETHGADGRWCTWDSGGHAVFARNSTILVQSSTFLGGDAGVNDDDFCPGACGCGDPGSGLVLRDSSAVVSASEIRKGYEGPGFLGSCATNGCGWGGTDLLAVGSTVVDGVDIAPTLTPSTNAIVDGGTLTFIATGAPGSDVAILAAFEGQSLALPGTSGHLLIEAPQGGRRVQLGTIPASGMLTWTYSVGDLPTGVHVPVHFQSGEVDVTGGLTLGPARIVHLLDSSL